MRSTIFTVLVLLAASAANEANAQSSSTDAGKGVALKSYLIERDIPGAGKLSPQDLKGISQKSCSVLEEMTAIEWVHSYVAGDKIFCVYKAENESLIRKHAEQGGFPITNITEINTTISPATAK